MVELGEITVFEGANAVLKILPTPAPAQPASTPTAAPATPAKPAKK